MSIDDFKRAVLTANNQSAMSGGAPVAPKAPPPIPGKRPPPLPPKPATDPLTSLQNMQPASDAADRLRAIAAQLPAYNPDTTPPKPEAGYINSPEAEGLTLAATPEELAAQQGIVAPQPTIDDLDGMTKPQLIECGLAIGAFEQGTKLRETGLRKAIRAKRAERAAVVEDWAGAGFISETSKESLVKTGSFSAPTLKETIAETAQGMADAGAISQEDANDIKATAYGCMADSGEETVTFKSDANSFTLYIDCSPISDDYVYTGAWLEAEANKLIHGEFPALKFADWRLVQYGQGAALLCHYAAPIVRERQLPAIVLDTRTPAGSVLVNALSLIATNIVRGLR